MSLASHTVERLREACRIILRCRWASNARVVPPESLFATTVSKPSCLQFPSLALHSAEHIEVNSQTCSTPKRISSFRDGPRQRSSTEEAPVVVAKRRSWESALTAQKAYHVPIFDGLEEVPQS